ncbi:hypothetical protein ABPG73_007543, partial [Tetrahymena malaccensis]
LNIISSYFKTMQYDLPISDSLVKNSVKEQKETSFEKKSLLYYFLLVFKVRSFNLLQQVKLKEEIEDIYCTE